MASPELRDPLNIRPTNKQMEKATANQAKMQNRQANSKYM